MGRDWDGRRGTIYRDRNSRVIGKGRKIGDICGWQGKINRNKLINKGTIDCVVAGRRIRVENIEMK